MISIITVTYKDPVGLSETIESLHPMLSASEDWEHVIVDSSPAVNREHIEALRSSNWPLVYIEQEPKGIYAAMNYGIGRAKGESFILLNGGDLLKSPEALVKAASLFEDPGVDLVIGGADRMRDGKFRYSVFPKKDFRSSLMGFNYICHQSVLYRKSSFERVGDFSTELKIASDFEHHLKCWLSGFKAKFIDESLVAVDSDGASGLSWKASLDEVESVGRRFRHELGIRNYVEFQLRNSLSKARIGVLKGVASSPIGKSLQPLWVKYNRMRAK